MSTKITLKIELETYLEAMTAINYRVAVLRQRISELSDGDRDYSYWTERLNETIAAQTNLEAAYKEFLA